MDDAAGGCIAIAVGLAVAAFVIYLIVMAVVFVLAGVYCLIITLIVFALVACDGVMSAHLAASNPAMMWMIWGAIIGGALAFWTVAPLYGLRKQRPLIAGAPFALMAVIAALSQTLN